MLMMILIIHHWINNIRDDDSTGADHKLIRIMHIQQRWRINKFATGGELLPYVLWFQPERIIRRRWRILIPFGRVAIARIRRRRRMMIFYIHSIRDERRSWFDGMDDNIDYTSVTIKSICWRTTVEPMIVQPYQIRDEAWGNVLSHVYYTGCNIKGSVSHEWNYECLRVD